MSVPLLPDGWKQVEERVRSVPCISLFLDFDGTLSRLVSDPRDARLDHATRGALARLARNPRVHVCVISGRCSDDLRARVALPGVRYLGVHGSDTGAADFAPELVQRVSTAREQLAAGLNGTAGVHVEDKRLSFALHYRGARAEAVHRAGKLLREIVADSSGGLRMLPGDCVWEVLPQEIRGKGYAAWKHWRATDTNALPIYVGNDSTDESAFRTLAAGITVRVGPVRYSKARYSLRNIPEVRRFLIQLEREVHL